MPSRRRSALVDKLVVDQPGRPQQAILDVLADIDAVPSWSSLHESAEVIDRHPDGRPHHVKATLKIMGISDKEIVEYNWGERWMVWDSSETFRQRGLHVEYNLTPEGEDRTRVRFDIIMELAAPVPAFLIKTGQEDGARCCDRSIAGSGHGKRIAVGRCRGRSNVTGNRDRGTAGSHHGCARRRRRAAGRTMR